MTESKTIKTDKTERTYSTGKRKCSVARVWIKPGKGVVEVNGKKMGDYFQRATLQMIVNQPFQIIEKLGKFDVFATVLGGGLSGQALAIKHGISKALTLVDEAFRPALKKEGFLTRDAREVERKKPGKPKARKSFQFSKR